jgi:nucleoside-diphosphate-sugar epimerase
MDSAFVTGATGGIGSVLCERLSQSEWKVVALVRRGSDASAIKDLPGLEILSADLLNEPALAAAMRGCDTVFHLAAKVHAPAGEPEEEFTRVNVKGTRAVVNAAIAARVKTFIYFSTVAVYPETDDVYDEDSAGGPSTPYGATKLAGEAIVLEQRARMNVTILRLPVVYGPRDRGNVGKMIDAIRRRRFVMPGKGATVKTMVAVDNVVDAAIACAADTRARGKIYIVTDQGAATLRSIVDVISSALGVRPPLSLPTALVKALGTIADRVRGVVNLPVTRDQIDKLTADTRYKGDRIRRELGVQPRLGVEEAMRLAIGQKRGPGSRRA